MIDVLKKKGYLAALFDMDGTVMDTTGADFQAWNLVLKKYGSGLTYPEYVKQLGVKSETLIHELVDISSEEADKALKKKADYFKEIIEVQGLKAIDNVEACLEKLQEKGFKIALATAARFDKLEEVFSRVKLQHYFETIVTANEVSHGKPHPEIFLKAAQKLKISPDKCIVFEDAENGVKAAKNAGMFCIAITSTTLEMHLQKADLIVHNYKELLNE